MMKFVKLFLFIFLAFISVQALTVQAGSGSGSVTVDVASVNGVCGATHYNCTTGTSSTGGSGTGGYSWQCLGLNGGSTASCSELSKYTVTASAGPGGSISPSSRTVDYNTSTSFTIALSPNYKISSVTGCNGTLSGNLYTTGNITGNCSVSASFTISSCANGANNPPTCTTFTPCANGATNPPTCTTFNTPSGTLSGSNCTIAKDSSTCTTTLTLSITNPKSGATTNITKPTNVVVATGITPSSKSGIVVSYPSTTFYLNHDGSTLSTKTINASCTSGTKWDTSTGKCKTTVVATCTNGAVNYPTCTIDSNNKCLNGATNPPICTTFPPCANGANNPPTCTTFPPCANGATNPPTCTTFSTCPNGATNPPACTLFAVNGICSSPDVHYTCTAGTSTNNVNGTSAYTWTCAGANGGSSDSCSEPKTMSGSLNATDCVITSGSSCSTNLVWSTTNPVSTSAVTTPTNITIKSANSSSSSYVLNGPVSRNFYLYNNGVLLAQDTATSSCPSGTTWNGSLCVVNNTNPNPGNNDVDGEWIWGEWSACSAQCDEGSGTQTRTGVCNPPSGNGAPCAGPSVQTRTCNLGSCSGNNGNGGGDLLGIIFQSSASTIFKGKTATLDWTSSADSCTLSTNGGVSIDADPDKNLDTSEGTVIVKPSSSTTYVLTCTRGATEETKETEVKVSSITVIEI